MSQLFSKKSLDKVSSPEQLNDYIRVANPSLWLVLGAVIVLLIGVCVWGVLGRMDTTVAAAAVSENGQTTVYVKEADAENVAENLTVRINDAEYTITSVSQTPIVVDDSFSAYALHLLDLHKDEWVYTVAIDGSLPDGVYSAEIVIESVAPIFFVLN